MNNMLKYYHKGFTMIEALLSLLIASLCVLIISMCLNNVLYFISINNINQDIIAIKQLRTTLMEYEIKEVNPKEILLINDDKEYYLRYKNHNLYLTNGSLIFMKNIDDAYFKIIDDKVYLYYQKGIYYEVLLQKYQGIL